MIKAQHKPSGGSGHTHTPHTSVATQMGEGVQTYLGKQRACITISKSYPAHTPEHTAAHMHRSLRQHNRPTAATAVLDTSSRVAQTQIHMYRKRAVAQMHACRCLTPSNQDTARSKSRQGGDCVVSCKQNVPQTPTRVSVGSTLTTQRNPPYTTQEQQSAMRANNSVVRGIYSVQTRNCVCLCLLLAA